MPETDRTNISHLPWRRYWCPRSGRIPVVDGGYVVAPGSGLAKWLKGDLVPFQDLSHVPCLALLGEPGIGKSTALAGEVRVLTAAAEARGESLHYVDLKPYGSEDRLG